MILPGALLALDTIVAGDVEEGPGNDPPASPEAGTCYLIGPSPTGEWAQFADHLAAFTGGGWRYITPVIGMSVLIKADGAFAIFGANGWETGTIRGDRVLVNGQQVVAARAAAVADPTGGVTVDEEARAALVRLLSALRQHGLISD
jgi:hypothetical protein